MQRNANQQPQSLQPDSFELPDDQQSIDKRCDTPSSSHRPEKVDYGPSTAVSIQVQHAQAMVAMAQALQAQAEALRMQAQALIAFSSIQTPRHAHHQSTPQTHYSHLNSSDETEMVEVNKTVLEAEPETRNPTYTPLVVAQLPENKPRTLQAKIDTGADVNVIAFHIVRLLGREAEIEDIPRGLVTNEIGNNHCHFSKRILLTFSAGSRHRTFQDVEFLVTGIGNETETDGLPDVLLGLPMINMAHMIMTDIEYSIAPDPSYGEPLNKLAEEEGENGRTPKLFILKSPTAWHPSQGSKGSKR